MMKHAVRVMLWVMVAVLVSVPAMAQTPQWTDRGFLNVNFVFQVESDQTVTTSSTLTVYDEKATASPRNSSRARARRSASAAAPGYGRTSASGWPTPS